MILGLLLQTQLRHPQHRAEVSKPSLVENTVCTEFTVWTNIHKLYRRVCLGCSRDRKLVLFVSESVMRDFES